MLTHPEMICLMLGAVWQYPRGKGRVGSTPTHDYDQEAKV